MGKKEILEIEKALHVLELELARLRKEQDALVVEVDRAIYKKDNIALKYGAKENSDPNCKGGFSRASKDIETLKSAIAFSQRNMQELE